MKSRSHRLPITEPHHDDWVDGSWTVDCICGVNFDDGEEMVDCDECGVWVHTRCSRYVKSEKSFACDKCKSKNSAGGGAGGGGSVRNDSEETEVAEFLVELPTKTLTMDNPNPPAVSAGRPFRLWTDIPMEERVHEQGVPGGETALFSGVGMSSVFGPQLWKCAGYVPKKFNFRYTEFPCLDHAKVDEKEEGRMEKTSGEENANRVDNGAGVLFSLLNKNNNTLPAPVVDSVGVKRRGKTGTCPEVVVTPRERKKPDVEKSFYRSPEKSIKKEGSSVRVVLNSGNRRKEELGMSKDQHVKKKARPNEKEGDVKKRAFHSSKAASTFSSDGKQLEYSQDTGSKAVNDIQCGKDVNGDGLHDGLGECATNLASNEHNLESTLRNDVSSDKVSREGNKGDQVRVESENVSKTTNGMESLAEVSGSQSMPVKEEVTGDTLQRCAGDTGSVKTGSHGKDTVVVDVRINGADARESERNQDVDIDEANSRPNKKLKGQLNADDHVESLHLNDIKLDNSKATAQRTESSAKVASEEGKVVEMTGMSSEVSEPKPKMIDANRKPILGSSRIDKSDELAGNACQSKIEPSVSEGSMGARKRSSGHKHGLEVADELLKSNGTARSHSTASYQRKTVASLSKSTSTSGCVMSKSSENETTATVQSLSVLSRQKEISDRSLDTVKDNSLADKFEHEEKCGRPKKLIKESSKSSSLTKISESTKFVNKSDSKRTPSDSKDPSIYSSSKVSSVPTVASARVSGECVSPPTMEAPSSVQNRAASSAVPGKSEKVYQSSGHPSSKGHVASTTAPTSSNIPATLSDEELALLLHQELNSSPRVPRVPRMRHAGSLPQLACPGATSMLMKRTSSGGSKDQGVASKRRTKDFPGEGSHASLEVDNEPKKMERKPYSPDNRRQDSGHSVDPLSRKEADGGLVKSVQSKKTNMSSSLSSSSEANGHNVSSSRPSSRNVTDDDPRTVGRQTNRTLPGLLAEIMSEGKRTSYEKLCNAVLPHWPHLRKHNGERYAYSSHSQAVLDCLRNRTEWSRLVDRGPKTNASRKRRKLDADSVSIESEDNEDESVKNAKDVGSKSFDSHQEDFPKGKRKARKRRRLALQGRGIVRRRRRADVVSDDESESFSNSSEDSMSSEEEIQGGGGTSVVGSEASASSDEGR